MGALLAGLAAYIQQERHDHIAKAAPANPVTLVTMTAVVILFVIVVLATPHGMWVRLPSGVIAAIAAPWIFELPFDLIIMARTYPSVPPDPAMYRALFFAPSSWSRSPRCRCCLALTRGSRGGGDINPIAASSKLPALAGTQSARYRSRRRALQQHAKAGKRHNFITL